MQKINQEIKDYLRSSNCTGDLDILEVADDIDVSDLKIKNCNFVGINRIFGKVSLENSSIKNSVLSDSVKISDSNISKSFIGSGAIIVNYSIVNDTVISSTTLPKSNNSYISVVNNSQITGDVILGGCDFNKTKSRGGSVFAFAHIGEGEFKGNIIIGNPPTAGSEKTLVEIGHFGYYGDLIVLSFRVSDKEDSPFDLDCEEYYNATKQVLLQTFFETTLTEEINVKRGRTNLGAGTVISNYDPIRGIKAGAIIILSSTGANVSLSPYLTVFPNSLIASGSVDITREKNVIWENSLVIGARSQSVVLEKYYDESKRQIMNDRSVEEMAYLKRNLSFLETISEVFAEGANSENSFESFAFVRALEKTKKSASEIVEKSVPRYFELLENSVKSIEEIVSQNPSRAKDFEPRLYAHSNVLGKKEEIRSSFNSKLVKISTLFEKHNGINNDKKFEQEHGTDEKNEYVTLTRKQKSVVEELF